MKQDTAVVASAQASREASRFWARQCYEFLIPLLRDLDRLWDRRVVQTLLDLILILVIHRHRNPGLVLSELGGHVLGAVRAPAGVKRIATLWHASRGSGAVVDDFLWAQADHHVPGLQDAGQPA